MSPRVRVGTQGWSYDGWVGPFYPPGTRSADWLALYARAFDIVEVDSTFYAHPPADRLESWSERTPDGFTFTLKMPGEVTHELRLRDPRPAIRFCDDALLLGPKLGAVLVQLPPRHGPAAFADTAAFLDVLPDDLRIVVEFRDRAWLEPRTFDMLRETGTSLALSTGPWMEEAGVRDVAAGVAEADLLYLRWMAPIRHVVHPGRDPELEAWARLIPELQAREVYAFFNNDYQGHSPASARRLQSLLGQEPVEPGSLSPQRELFG